MKNTTVLHSIVGVAGAMMVGLVTLGIGQTAAPPAGVPPVSPAPVPALPPTPAVTPPPPVPVANPPVPALEPAAPAPQAGAGIPGAGAAPEPRPRKVSKGERPPTTEPPIEMIKGEFQTREWKVPPAIFDDGHGGSTSAKDFLQRHGIPFPKGSFAMYSPETSTLIVRNLTDPMKSAEGIISHLGGVPVTEPKERAVVSVSSGGAMNAYARAPGAPGPPSVNYSRSAPAPKKPREQSGLSYGMGKEFPVTSIEVAQAHLAEELNQDPQGAASRYAAIVANFDAQRQAAATAIYGLGESYRKMGRNAEARIQYARILREFVDFPELTRQSQRQLGATPPARDEEGNAFAARTDVSDEERALLREELSLLEKEWQTTQERIKAGVTPTNEGLQLQRDILKLKQQLARLPREANRTPTPTAEKHEPHGEGGGAATEPVQRR